MTPRHSIAVLTTASAITLAAATACAQAPERPALTAERIQAMSECDAMTNRTDSNSRTMPKDEFLAFMARKAEICAVAHPGNTKAPEPTNWLAIGAAMAAIPALALGFVVLRGRRKHETRPRRQAP